MDHVVTATAGGGMLRVRAAVTTALVAEARDRQDLSPTATAALGRLLTGAGLMGAALKGDQRVALQVAGSGPLRNLLAEAFPHQSGIGVRGYAVNPDVELPLNPAGKFDVGAAVGTGVLQVTRTLESGQPYTGIVPLATGEIGDDLAWYFAQSEQTPCVVALGVLANPRGVLASGGIIAELLPGAPETTVVTVEHATRSIPAVTTLIREGATPTDLIRRLVGHLAPQWLREVPLYFACRCSWEKVRVAIRGLGAQTLREMAREDHPQVVTCDYCKRVYHVTPEAVASLAASS